MFTRAPISVLFFTLFLFAGNSNAEDYFKIYGGYQSSSNITNVTGNENIRYSTNTPVYAPFEIKNVDLKSTLTAGIGVGRYFKENNGWGIEIEGQYSKPNLIRQNTVIRLTDRPYFRSGTQEFDTIVEDQLPLDVHLITFGLNALYRFDVPSIKFTPYLGFGPVASIVLLRGSADSCKIISPSELIRDYCQKGNLKENDYGYGYNLKIGFYYPVSSKMDVNAEFKHTDMKLKIDELRSISGVSATYKFQSISVGLRYKF